MGLHHSAFFTLSVHETAEAPGSNCGAAALAKLRARSQKHIKANNEQHVAACGS